MKRVVFLLMLLLLPAVYTAEEPELKKEIIEEIMELSGINQQLEQFPVLLKVQFGLHKTLLDDDEAQRLLSSMLASFEGGRLRESAYQFLSDNYDEKKFTRLLEQLNTPLSRRMYDLGRITYDEKSPETLKKFMASLNSNPPSREKKLLMVRLDEATNTTRYSLNLFAEMLTSLLYNINDRLPAERQLSTDDIARKVRRIRYDMGPIINGIVLTNFLMALGNVDDGDMFEYIAFYESSLGRWSSDLSNRMYIKVLTQAFGQAGSRIAGDLSLH